MCFMTNVSPVWCTYFSKKILISASLLGVGLEYPAVVDFAPFPKVPKRRPKKADPRKGTIEAG